MVSGVGSSVGRAETGYRPTPIGFVLEFWLFLASHLFAPRHQSGTGSAVDHCVVEFGEGVIHRKTVSRTGTVGVVAEPSRSVAANDTAIGPAMW